MLASSRPPTPHHPSNLVISATLHHKPSVSPPERDEVGMKGHPQTNGAIGSGGGGLGWWFTKLKLKMKKTAVMMVVVLGFAAAIMAVMALQRLRERRVFNLVIKDKDRQIFSLQLLLQKEIQFAKESKRKNQELNAKLYSLRTAKMELNNKILEMRSTISSLRDEERTLELALEEKQKEIKQKESIIKDLKGSPLKVWSVSSDDPSNPEVNLTKKVAVVQRGGTEAGLTLGLDQSTINGKKLGFGEERRAVNKIESSQESNTEAREYSDEDRKDEAEDRGVKDKDGDKIEMEGTDGEAKGDKKGISEENGVPLGMRGRKFFTGASESRRNKSRNHGTGMIRENGTSSKGNVTFTSQNLQGRDGSRIKTDDQSGLVYKEDNEDSQKKENREEVSTESKQVDAENTKEDSTGEVDRAVDKEQENISADQDAKAETDRMDEDDADGGTEDEEIHGSNMTSTESNHGSEADDDYKEEGEE